MVVDVPGHTFGNGLFSEYYGISGTDRVDPPILDNPNETRTIDGRNYLLFYDGDRLRLVGFKTKTGAYWVNNTLLQSLDEGEMLSIATSMREYEEQSTSVPRPVNANEKPAIGVIGVGWVGLVTAACFAELDHRWSRWTSTRGRSRRCARAAAADARARPARGGRAQPRAPAFTTEIAELLDAAACSSAASTRRRPTPATPTSSRSRPWSSADPRGGSSTPGDEEHRARRHRGGDPASEARSRLRVLPGVPQGGLRGQRLPRARPGRGRRRPRRRMGCRRGRRRPTSPSTASSCAPTSPRPR